jgi:hypothetical protein
VNSERELAEADAIADEMAEREFAMSGIPEDIVAGGQGRSGADVLWYACCACGIFPLWFFRNLFPSGDLRRRESAEVLFSNATTGERVPVSRATTRRGGGELLESE